MKTQNFCLVLILLFSLQAGSWSAERWALSERTMRGGAVVSGLGFTTMVLSLILLGGYDEVASTPIPKFEKRKEFDPVFYFGFSLVSLGFLVMPIGFVIEKMENK